MKGRGIQLGVNIDGVSDGRFAEMYSPVRAFTPEERARLKALSLIARVKRSLISFKG